MTKLYEYVILFYPATPTINAQPVRVDSSAESIKTQRMPAVMLTVREVMTRLNLSRQNVYDAIKQGRLRGAKDPETRTWLIYESSVRSYQPPIRGRKRRNSGDRNDHQSP